MDCTDFIHGFSDYVDGLDEERQEAFERHRASCDSCSRYVEVYRRGRDLLRSFPEVGISEDFHPRLQHRVLHVKDEEALARGSASGATATTVLGIALVLTAAAWSPALKPAGPQVQLAPIVVTEPARPRLGIRAQRVELSARNASTPTPEDLWEMSNRLLYEYSPLNERYRRTTVTRTGLD